MDVNGFNCCGEVWLSSACNHTCSRGEDHKGFCRCGWCGRSKNPLLDPPSSFEEDWISTDGEHASRRKNFSVQEASRLTFDILKNKNENLLDLREDFEVIEKNLLKIFDIDNSLFLELKDSFKQDRKSIESILNILVKNKGVKNEK